MVKLVITPSDAKLNCNSTGLGLALDLWEGTDAEVFPFICSSIKYKLILM